MQQFYSQYMDTMTGGGGNSSGTGPGKSSFNHIARTLFYFYGLGRGELLWHRLW